MSKWRSTRGWKCVWAGSWWREGWFREGSTLAFGKVLDSENAKAGRDFGDYPPPISYFIAEANGPREGQGITHGITRTSERRMGGDFMPFFSVWLVLSADDILHLLVVAHGFPTPLGLGQYFLAPFIIVNLRRAILIPTACVHSVARGWTKKCDVSKC